MKKPDLHQIHLDSYACGLPKHLKHTRDLLHYIEFLEQELAKQQPEPTEETE